MLFSLLTGFQFVMFVYQMQIFDKHQGIAGKGMKCSGLKMFAKNCDIANFTLNGYAES